MNRKISGFGNILTTSSDVYPLKKLPNILELQGRNVCPRGMGNAYGDSATNNANCVFTSRGLDSILEIDSAKATCKVESGVLVGTLAEQLAKQGLALPVVPGSAYISLGGCLASDVHGKNHFKSGSFSDHILDFTLQDKFGNLKTISRNSKTFHATAGGMGMTGFIVDMTIQCKRVDTGMYQTKKIYFKTISDGLEILKLEVEKSEHLIAWIDLTSSKNFGQGIVYSSTISISQKLKGIFLAPPKLLTIPRIGPNLMSRTFTRNYNRFRIKTESQKKEMSVSESYWKVMFPSDLFRKWNNLFGRKGLMEYQFLLPFSEEKQIEQIFAHLSQLANPALVAIKVLGNSNNNYLSFPSNGFLCGVTFPWNSRLKEEIHKIDKLLLKFNGKKYLSKDLFTHGDVIKKMYPSYEKFLNHKKEIDPDFFWNSDQFNRIFGHDEK